MRKESPHSARGYSHFPLMFMFHSFKTIQFHRSIQYNNMNCSKYANDPSPTTSTLSILIIFIEGIFVICLIYNSKSKGNRGIEASTEPILPRLPLSRICIPWWKSPHSLTQRMKQLLLVCWVYQPNRYVLGRLLTLVQRLRMYTPDL